MPWQMTRVSLSQLHSTDSDTPTSTAIETQQHETAIEPQQHDTARLVRSAPSHSNCYRHSYAAEPRSPLHTGGFTSFRSSGDPFSSSSSSGMSSRMVSSFS